MLGGQQQSQARKSDRGKSAKCWCVYAPYEGPGVEPRGGGCSSPFERRWGVLTVDNGSALLYSIYGRYQHVGTIGRALQ